jgi:hypothetical protein
MYADCLLPTTLLLDTMLVSVPHQSAYVTHTHYCRFGYQSQHAHYQLPAAVAAAQMQMQTQFMKRPRRSPDEDFEEHNAHSSPFTGVMQLHQRQQQQEQQRMPTGHTNSMYHSGAVVGSLQQHQFHHYITQTPQMLATAAEIAGLDQQLANGSSYHNNSSSSSNSNGSAVHATAAAAQQPAYDSTHLAQQQQQQLYISSSSNALRDTEAAQVFPSSEHV